jgi:hypothetical protein
MSLSRFKPVRYTQIFIPCDILSLVLQGAGGGLASVASQDNADSGPGTDVMIAGLCFQVVSLLLFGFLCADYFLRVYSHRDAINPSTSKLRSSIRFRSFLAALLFTYTFILVRCIYRVIELAGGWGNALMQNETEFVILEGV